jgi:hypothetical protein
MLCFCLSKNSQSGAEQAKPKARDPTLLHLFLLKQKQSFVRRAVVVFLLKLAVVFA